MYTLLINPNGQYSAPVTHDLEWRNWAIAHNVKFVAFDDCSDAHRAFWSNNFPGWTNERVEQATENTAWPFYQPK